VAIAGVVVVAAIGTAGLIISYHYSNESGNDRNAEEIFSNESENDKNVEEAIEETVDRFNDFPAVLGGSGSWFLSRMERFDG
jgi:hypothetical protein